MIIDLLEPVASLEDIGNDPAPFPHIECVEMNWANFIVGGFLLWCATLPQPIALESL